MDWILKVFELFSCLGHQESDLHLPKKSNESFDKLQLFIEYPPNIVVKRQHRQTSKNSSSKLTVITEYQCAVKWGPDLSLAECQAQWYARVMLLPHGIPVPQTFGWRTYEGNRFLYMELVPGQEYYHLNHMHAVGEVDRRKIEDTIREWIRVCESVVPPRSLASDYNLNQHVFPFKKVPGLDNKAQDIRDAGLGSSPPYYFAHGGLHGHNIMLECQHGHWRISGLVDWEKAGWYPKNWQREAWRARCEKLEREATMTDPDYARTYPGQLWRDLTGLLDRAQMSHTDEREAGPTQS
ncbi:MAG: hypothetical protein Q9162_005780 [Coniocarpon cinnabarinum]